MKRFSFTRVKTDPGYTPKTYFWPQTTTKRCSFPVEKIILFTRVKKRFIWTALDWSRIDQFPIDSGVACEIGVAYASGIPIIGLYTDIRSNREGSGRMYKNQYVMGAIEAVGEVVYSIDQLLQVIPKYLWLEMVASRLLSTSPTDRWGRSIREISTYRYRLGTRSGLANHSWYSWTIHLEKQM